MFSKQSVVDGFDVKNFECFISLLYVDVKIKLETFRIELLKEILIRLNILFHFVSINLPIEMFYREVRVN